MIYQCLLRHSLVAASQPTTANRQNYETPPALRDPNNSLTNCCQHLKNRYLQRGGMSVDTLWYALLRPLPGPPSCGPKAHPLPLVICQIPMDLWIFKHLDAGAPTAALPPTCAGPVVSGNATISSTWTLAPTAELPGAGSSRQCSLLSAAPRLPTRAGGSTPPRWKELSYERSAVHTYADLGGDEICLGWVNLNAVVAALAHASQLMLWARRKGRAVPLSGFDRLCIFRPCWSSMRSAWN
jgi:hypothetical protein